MTVYCKATSSEVLLSTYTIHQVIRLIQLDRCAELNRLRPYTQAYRKYTEEIRNVYRISGSGWPDIRPFFPNPVPVSAKMVPGTGYLSQIVIGPF